jgi:hypothetical protein
MFHCNDDNKSHNQGSTKNSNIRHCAQTADCTGVKEQNEVTLHTAQIVTAEHLQHYTP